LFEFHKAGGISALAEITRRFTTSIARVMFIAVEDRSTADKHELVCAYAGLKVLLHLMGPVVSAKLVFESPQTALLHTPDKKDGDIGYFHPSIFLVRSRLSALPIVKELWNASWLLSAPVGVIKSFLSVALELVRAELEEMSATPNVQIPSVVTLGLQRAEPVRPDEDCIQQISEMGFSRGAATRALIRARNDVATATELLLTQPELFAGGDDEDTAGPAPTNEAMDEDTTDEGRPSEPPTDVVSDIPTDAVASMPSPLTEKKSEEWKKELDEQREPLREDVGRLALRLVDEHPSLIFEVQTVFIGSLGSHQDKSLRQLVADVKAFSPAAYDLQEQPMAVRCRLLALALNNPTTQELLRPEAKDILEVLLALVLSRPVGVDGDSAAVPKWLAAHLLVAEALLMMGEHPRSIELPKEGDVIPSEELATGPLYLEARSMFFDLCLKLIAIPSLPSTELLSTLRLTILLTRDHRLARNFVEKDGLEKLFDRLKLASGDSEIAIKSHVMIVLRNIVENPAILRSTMELVVKRLLSSPKFRATDPKTYIRACSTAALRDPLVFIEATESLCQLSRPFSNQQISLKDENLNQDLKDVTGAGDKSAGIPAEVTGGSFSLPTLPSSPETIETTVHYLIGELLKASRNAMAPPTRLEPAAIPMAVDPPTTTSAPTDPAAVTTITGDITQPATAEPSAPRTSDEEDQMDYLYCCTLMQMLTELLFSYDACKTAFLSYSPKKRQQTIAKDPNQRYRTIALHFLLNEMINYGTIDPQDINPKQRRIIICNWAMSVVVALCVDPSSSHDLKDIPAEVTAVRKFVIDGISKTFRELSSSERVETRYGRMMALADLCHRLLTVRPHLPAKKQDEGTPTHIAKIMLEKNLVATLTGMLGEVDLNYPDARGLVSALLRPLEYL
jgi:E3 ubiquitin-protein ligase HUWE1